MSGTSQGQSQGLGGLAALQELLNADVGQGVWDLLRDDSAARSRGTTGILLRDRNRDQPEGFVGHVLPGSPASLSNIVAGDEIIEVDGSSVQRGMLADQLKGSGVVGSQCQLKIRRDGRIFEVSIPRCSFSDVAQASEVKDRVQQFKSLIEKCFGSSSGGGTVQAPYNAVLETSLQLEAAASLMITTRYKQAATLYQRLEALRQELRDRVDQVRQAGECKQQNEGATNNPSVEMQRMQTQVFETKSAMAVAEQELKRLEGERTALNASLARERSKLQDVERQTKLVYSETTAALEELEQARSDLQEIKSRVAVTHHPTQDTSQADASDTLRIQELEGQVESLRQLVHTVVSTDREAHSKAMEKWQQRILQLQTNLVQGSQRMVAEIRSREFELLRQGRLLAQKDRELAVMHDQVAALKADIQALSSSSQSGQPLPQALKASAPRRPELRNASAAASGGFGSSTMHGEALPDIDGAL